MRTIFLFLRKNLVPDDGLEEIVSLLREYELTEEDKQEIIIFLENFLANKKDRYLNNNMQASITALLWI